MMGLVDDDVIRDMIGQTIWTFFMILHFVPQNK
jgi:hypothetical protein